MSEPLGEFARLKPRVCADGFVLQGGAVVGNVFLSRLAYQHTIEPMVRSLFPDATYTQCDDRWIKDIPDIDKGGTLVIQGQKGFGKSKAIRLLRDTYFKDKSIVHINFSRSLAYFSAIKRGKGVHHYAKDEEPLTADLLEVVINSLARVKRPYDVVIIDEVVSVMSSISGSLITDTHRMNVLNCLRRLLVAAKYVIIADAFIEPVTVHFVRTLRGSWSPLRFIDYTCRPQNGHDCVVYRTKDGWKTALMKAIGAGLNVVVPCMYRYMVKNLKMDIQRAWPDVVVQAYYDGPGSDDTAGAMKNIKRWKRCQVLIYSPCITAGCSFEEKHFDTQFFYGVSSPFTGNVQSALQMTSRVRDIKNHDIHVYIDDGYWGPDHPPDLHLPTSDPNNPMAVLDASVKCIQLFSQRSFRSKVSGFANDFFQHKLDAGFWIRYPCGTDMDYLKDWELDAPAPPVKCTEETNADLLAHLTMSDLERKMTVGHLYPLIDSTLEEDAELDFYQVAEEVKDKETLEWWGFLMTMYFLRSYQTCDVVHDFPFLRGKFDNFELESTLRAKVKIYMQKGNERQTFRASLADKVWALAVATIAFRKGRRLTLGMANAKFPGPKGIAKTVVRHTGWLLTTILQNRKKRGWHCHIIPNLPHVCAKEEESHIQGHFIIVYTDIRKDVSEEERRPKETHLYLLTWEDPHCHQLKNDFLRLFCQASFLGMSTPYKPTHVECIHMGRSQSWNVPFGASVDDCTSIVTMFQTREAQWIRSRVGILEVDYTFGVLHASYWPPKEEVDDPTVMHEMTTLKELYRFIREVSASDVYVAGFGIWEDLAEIFDVGCGEDEGEMVDHVHKFFDLQLMVQSLVDPDLANLIDDHTRIMGLGYYVAERCDALTTPLEKFIDAFVDIKQSKGVTYMLPNESLVSVKCGDVMCIGDCLNLM